MADGFRIPFQEAESEFVEKRSRFISHVWRVETEEEAQARIQETKKKTTIVRVEDSTTAAETTKAPETTPQTAAPSTQAETAPQTTAPTSEAAEETTVKVIRVSDNGDSDASSDYIVHAAAETAAPAEIAASEESEESETDPELSGAVHRPCGRFPCADLPGTCRS